MDAVTATTFCVSISISVVCQLVILQPQLTTGTTPQKARGSGEIGTRNGK